MSKKKVVSAGISPTESKSTSYENTSPSSGDTLMFNRQNYILMFVGALLIFGGMLLMIGGHQPDANTWDPNIIYSTRITLIAPAVIIAGLIVEVIAIFKKS